MKQIDYRQLVKTTYAEWQKDKAPRLGAALAYYTMFSLAPLLLLCIAIAGFVFSRQTAQEGIMRQLRELMGGSNAEAVRAMLDSARRPGSGILATVIGVGSLLLGAASVFGELQDDLNTIWNVTPPETEGLWATIRARFVSFSMVLGTGFLLVVSLVASAGMAAVGDFLSNLVPKSASFYLIEALNFLLSFGVITLMFALIYRVLPDTDIEWRDVWIGAVATALLFTIGKTILGKYLGSAGVASAYGAAGSLLVVLLWVYYSAQILFFGAEFTKVYARRHGSHAATQTQATKPPLNTSAGVIQPS